MPLRHGTPLVTVSDVKLLFTIFHMVIVPEQADCELFKFVNSAMYAVPVPMEAPVLARTNDW